MRNPLQFESHRARFRAFPGESIATADHETAAEASNRCNSRGEAVSVVEALICSVRIASEQAIFATDSDFEQS